MKNLKKILSAFVITLLFPMFAFSAALPHKIYACSSSDVGKAQMKSGATLKFHAIDDYKINSYTSVEDGAVLTVKVDKYVGPKRGKRDGYLKVSLYSYTVPSESNKEIVVKEDNLSGTLKLSSHLDKKELAKKAGVTVVGSALKIPGFSQAVAVSKGLINPNPEQSRLQSAGTNLYESTPLTYSEKGKDLAIDKDSVVVITLK